MTDERKQAVEAMTQNLKDWITLILLIVAVAAGTVTITQLIRPSPPALPPRQRLDRVLPRQQQSAYFVAWKTLTGKHPGKAIALRRHRGLLKGPKMLEEIMQKCAALGYEMSLIISDNPELSISFTIRRAGLVIRADGYSFQHEYKGLSPASIVEKTWEKFQQTINSGLEVKSAKALQRL